MNIRNTAQAIIFTSVLGAATVFFSGCQSNTQSATPSSSDQATATSVTIQNMAFSESNIQVKVGQTVTWTNQDQFAHTVTSDTGEFDSGNLAAGGTFSHTFTKAGMYAYHCNIHSNMKATVTVE